MCAKNFFKSIAKLQMIVYNSISRTNRGGSGALYPQPATAEANSPIEVPFSYGRRLQGVLTVGSRATIAREPCQAGNRAAISGNGCVPRGRPA